MVWYWSIWLVADLLTQDSSIFLRNLTRLYRRKRVDAGEFGYRGLDEAEEGGWGRRMGCIREKWQGKKLK